MVTQATMADLKDLRALAALARSEKPFLTLYLNTEGETVPRNVQARLVDMLWAAQVAHAGDHWADIVRRERERVLPVAETIKPVGSGLIIASSEQAGRLEARWLPGRVEDHVSVRLGVYALPLLDLIDENEPVGVAFVENDKARLLLVAGGRVLDAEHFAADVPGRERAGGWQAPGRDRHRLDHVHRHLKGVTEALGLFHRRHGFARLFVGGPTEPLAMFKRELRAELEVLFAGEVAIDAHASDAEIAVQVMPFAEAVEREAESRLVDELVTAAEKGHGAVTGVDSSIGALNAHELATLVLDPRVELPATLCPSCDRLASEAVIRCPVCEGEVEAVDLREELPRHLHSGDVRLELVHGQAASVLWEHGSIAGILRIHQH